MCCIRGICILAPGSNVSANMIFHPVQVLYRMSLFEFLSVTKAVLLSYSSLGCFENYLCQLLNEKTDIISPNTL